MPPEIIKQLRKAVKQALEKYGIEVEFRDNYDTLDEGWNYMEMDVRRNDWRVDEENCIGWNGCHNCGSKAIANDVHFNGLFHEDLGFKCGSCGYHLHEIKNIMVSDGVLTVDTY